MPVTFSIMSAINGQLNLFAKFYDGTNSSIRSLSRVPNFVLVSINRATAIYQDILEIPDKDPIIDIVALTDSGDRKLPLYVCTIDNFMYPFVDKVPVMVNDEAGLPSPSIGYVIGIPKKIYKITTPIEDVAITLKQLYFRLLDLDPNMFYRAEPELIRLYNSPKAKVPTYDITMILVAIAMVNINLRSWFVNSFGEKLDSVYAVDSLTDNELPPKFKTSVREVINKYGKTMDTLVDSVASGILLKDLLYND